MFFFASPSLFRGGFVFFHIFLSMFSRVSAIYQKIIHIYCWLYRIVIYICKVNKAQTKNINYENIFIFTYITDLFYRQADELLQLHC